MGGKRKGEGGVGKIGAVGRTPSGETSLKERGDRELGVGSIVLDKKET